MANRRMFSQRIVGDESFLEMPSSSQSLYFHLGIYADDDGFVNPQKVVRMVGANPDDLKVLITKRFVLPMDGGVVVVTDWKENNYIRSDRYVPTIYQEQLKMLGEKDNKYVMDTECLPPGIPTVHPGKVRLGKGRVGKVNIMDGTSPSKEIKPPLISADQWHELIDSFKPVNPMFTNLYKYKVERSALEVMVKELGYEKTLNHIKSLERLCSIPFCPNITKPTELQRKLGALVNFENQLAQPTKVPNWSNKVVPPTGNKYNEVKK